MQKTGRFRFVAGFVCGAVIFGGTAAFAAGLVANPAGYEVYINGQRVNGVYNINGSTVLEGREFAERGGFAVTWDGSRALFDTRLPYGAVVPSPDVPSALAETPKPVAGGYGTAPKILKPGDVVKTTDGDYTVTAGQLERQAELERHGLAFGRPLAPDAPLPAWQPEWDGYPRVAIPSPLPARYRGDAHGAPYDSMTVFNGYEAERMIRTIYKYAKNNPALWKDKNPAANIPDFTVIVEFADGMEAHTFYPWENAVVTGEATIKKKVESTGGGAVFRIYAIDDYNNGKYLDTQYFMK